MSFLNDLAGRVRSAAKPLPSVAIGFDGFVDEMISVVGERRSLTAFDAVPDIATFGGLITKAAGHSSLREIVVNATHPGGCAVNMGDGLAALGVPVDCFATLGEPVHPAFGPVVSGFRSVNSWGREPGRTLAFEFSDGKLMFSSVSQLAEFTPEKVQTFLDKKEYLTACDRARVIALTDWTLYPHMTAVWRLLQQKVYARLSHRPHFFIDLVDPSSRSKADILGMLDTLPLFEAFGPLTLGLNMNEANILSRLLSIPEGQAKSASVMAQAQALKAKLRISEVVIHDLKFAVMAGSDGTATMPTAFCPNPKKSTGAGDRFNAGYCVGQLLNVDARARLACGNASASFFVREARSATLAELADFIPALPEIEG